MIKEAKNIPRKCMERARGGKGITQMNILLSPEELCNKGSLFNHVTLTPGSSIGFHNHKDDFEIYYILSGQGLYNDNGTDYRVSAGDITICNDGQGHGIENIGDEDLVMIALVLNS